MNTEQILERLELLFTILQYTTIKTDVLTAGERICINMERASLFELLDFNAGLREMADCRNYKVSPEIEKKIQSNINTINLSK